MAIIKRETTVENGKVIIREIEDTDFIQVSKKSKFNNGNFIVVFQKAMIDISKSDKLSKGALRVLFYLIGATEITNDVKMPIQSIADEIGEHRGNIYKFMKELEELNVILRDKQTKYLRLNYDLAYKGAVKDYKKLQYKDNPISIDAPSNQMSLLDAISQAKSL